MIQNIMIFLLVVLVLVACAFFYARRKILTVEDKKHLKVEIDAEVTKMTKGDPKEAIMVGVYKQGTSYFKSEGRFSEDLYQQPDQHSIFQIGSLSKLITVSVLHALIREGLVTMDSTLGELMGDKYELSEDAKSVTLHQLVTHTSGFPRVPKVFIDKTVDQFGKEDILKNPYSVLSFDDVIEYLKTSEGKKESGYVEYSNFGTGLLGHVLEVVSGERLDCLAKDKICSALGMNMTSTELSDEMNESMVQGYDRNGDKADLWTFGALEGAGGFNSTAADMLTFLKHFLNQSSDSKNPLDADGGWMKAGKLEKFYGNKNVSWHNGMVGGFSSYAAIDPVDDIAIIILSAKATDLTMPGIMLMRLARTQSWATSNPS
ncbi:serine hydrolase domain-containing protein [Leucothrix arctica]|uniref:Beta-lactamase-related domain-containing protein n=1 Tax=Leucothrix arctica TaxID=1481894 RepID=A0A317CMP2_9GAMM|nr:serine hydrolase [Leucothrix arctica]PWQ97582.1 hypothetical protein DKT75_06595 [Leucothrix arctica]